MYKNCDRIKFFSTDEMIEYIWSPKEFTTRLSEWISDFLARLLNIVQGQNAKSKWILCVSKNLKIKHLKWHILMYKSIKKFKYLVTNTKKLVYQPLNTENYGILPRK